MNDDTRTIGEKVSDIISRFGGSWAFIFTGFGTIVAWILFNQLITFDQYPYILLNLFLSLIAAFQAPFILMSQRRCEVKQDLIYRSLFREIKELVEADLSLENEIMERNKKLEKELRAVKKLLKKLYKRRDDLQTD